MAKNPNHTNLAGITLPSYRAIKSRGAARPAFRAFQVERRAGRAGSPR